MLAKTTYKQHSVQLLQLNNSKNSMLLMLLCAALVSRWPKVLTASARSTPPGSASMLTSQCMRFKSRFVGDWGLLIELVMEWVTDRRLPSCLSGLTR